MRALGEAGEGTAKQEEDPAVTEEGGQERDPSDTGNVAFIQPQGAHGSFTFFMPQMGPAGNPAPEDLKTRPTINRRPLVRAAPNHMPLVISFYSTCCFPQVHSRTV